MLREMASTYGRSPGGYVWAIIQPIGFIVILAIGFSLVIKSPSLGTSFVLFYATGYLPFDMYSQLVTKIINSLNYSAPMLTYPRVTWLDAFLARFLLNILTLSAVFCIVICAILYFANTRAIITLGPILWGMCVAACFGLAAGMFNCLINGFFPVWDVIWKIANRPMFIASGVFFIYEDMPTLVQDILWWNPVLHATGLVRAGFYTSYDATYVSLTYCFGLCLVLILFATIFLKAYHGKILER